MGNNKYHQAPNDETINIPWKKDYLKQFAEMSFIIEKIFGKNIVKFKGHKVHHMGNTALKGMAGTGVIDLCIVTKDFLSANIDDKII